MSPLAATTLIRPMVPADLDAAHRLSASFHWAHRLEDWALMLQLGDGVVTELDGVVAGTALSWRFGTQAATVGMIIVSEALHGRGIGRRMLQTLLDRLGGRTVRLNATPEGLKLYRALGFEPGGTVRKYQSDRLAPGQPPPGAVRELDASDLPWMAALDRDACGMDRTLLLAALLEHGDGIALGRDAFALRRRFGRGQLIGPVVAPDAEAAQRLVAHRLASLEGQLVRIDIPDRPELAAWLLERGFVAGDSVLGMVRGPAARQEKTTFALASQAYG